MHSTDRDRDGRRSPLAFLGLLLLPALCCGVPLLIAAGALGAIGSALSNPWVIGTAVVLAGGVIAFRMRHHVGK